MPGVGALLGRSRRRGIVAVTVNIGRAKDVWAGVKRRRLADHFLRIEYLPGDVRVRHPAGAAGPRSSGVTRGGTRGNTSG